MFKHSLIHIPITLLSICIIISCKDHKTEVTLKTDTITIVPPTSDSAIKGNFNTESGLKFDSAAITKFLEAKPIFKEFAQDYINFYRAQNYNYVWYNTKGLIQPALVLVSTLENVQQEGIFAKIPYREEYLALASHNDPKNGNGTAGPDIDKELLLTGEYFNYAKNVYTGAAGDKVKDWYLPRKKLSYDALLLDNIKADSFSVRENRVVAPQYAGLKKALALYRELEKKDKETIVPTLKKPVSPGANDSSATVTLLRKRLHELSYNITDTTSAKIDNELITAINLFKKTCGLKPDSVINNSMIRQLNIPVHKRIEQILVNMERFRWIPPDTRSDEFILVNIPEYMLHYFENGTIAWECNVVTGSPMTKTVIFNGLMTYIVFSPYWYVPPSIIKKEVVPGMKRNPNYLAAHNMEWNGGNVRQKPGYKNSLGLVKFMFPNSNNIYLHDTPSKSLFNEDERAFSHGCIRVARPKDLAMRILRSDSTWTSARIDKAMHAGKESTVTLKKKIPVYIGYFTAFIDKDGNLNFRDDVYKRDPEVLSLLMK